MNDYGDVLYEVKGHVGVITLNRPEKLNALSAALTAGMAKALTDAQEDDEVRVVIVTGAGRGFCSGADLTPPSGRTLADGPAGTPERPPSIADRRYNLRGVQKVGRAVLGLDKPYIAAVNGPAAGAGMDLASMADIRFAAKDARFTQAYTRNAIVPGNGGCYFLPRIVGMAKALELLWTSRTFDADEALAIGYVSRVVETERLMEETMAFAEELAAGPPVAIQYIKQLAYKSQQVDLDTSLRMAQWLQTIASATEDAREGPRAFREKRAPQFQGR
ncbi:MAG TPA: enoyl-CoA hydratase-related protein [Dehalococcoidia bacterium]|nr:enoyl-CoA hydratase-related protein [Dehalococcoidia bacterium]